MDRQAEDLLAVLQNKNVDEAIKLDLLTKIKAYVKHRAVAEEAIQPTFDVIRNTLGDGSAAIQESGYSLFSHLARRMTLQGQLDLLSHQCLESLSAIVRCLSDSKDRVQQRAIQALIDTWATVSTEVEAAILETLSGGRSRAKMASLQWVVKMHQSVPDFKFKHFVPILVQCLKDVGSVSASSKSALVKLFDSASDAAKNDLYKEMTTHNIAGGMRDEVLNKIGHRPRSSGVSFPRPGSATSQASNRPLSSASNRPRSSFSHSQSAMRASSRSRFDEASANRSHSSSRGAPSSKSVKDEVSSSHKKTLSATSTHKKENNNPLTTSQGSSTNTQPDIKKQKRPISAAPAMNSADALPPPVAPATKVELDPAKAIDILPNGTFFLSRYLTADNKDTTARLDEQARDMASVFEGKEVEHNWMRREKNLIIMRKITHGNAPDDFASAYIAMIRGNLDGILKCVNSLRTTVSSHGCCLVQEAAKAAGPALDPAVEIIMQNLVKLCGHTKTINAQNGNSTINVIFSNVTYKTPLLSHVTNACSDKNVRPRLFAQGWLKTIISRHLHYKHALEHGSGAEAMERIVNKGLADADPGVRESARDSYWTFVSVWPARGETIMANLKPNAQNQLLHHPSNPNPNISHTPIAENQKPKALSRSVATSSRPNLKEVMIAKKKEKAQLESQGSKSKDAAPQKVSIQPKASITTGSMSSAPLRPMRSKPALKKIDVMPKSSQAVSDGEPISNRISPVEQHAPSESATTARSTTPKDEDLRPEAPSASSETPKLDKPPVQSEAQMPGSVEHSPSKNVPDESPIQSRFSEGVSLLESMKLEKAAKTVVASPERRCNEPRQHLGELSDSRTNNGNITDTNARAIIDSGIKRITANTLDAHGYRKLRSTLSSNLDIINEDQLDKLTSAILPKLGDLTSVSDDRIVLQQNLLLTILFQGKRKFFDQYIPDVLCNIVLALSRYTDQSHVASNLSNSLLEFIQDTDFPAVDSLNALMALNKGNTLSLHGQTQYLTAIGSIVTQHIDFEGREPLLKDVLLEANNAMLDMDASIRRCGNLVAAAVFNSIKEEKKFWEIFSTLGKADKTMLLYTIQQQGKQ